MFKKIIAATFTFLFLSSLASANVCYSPDVEIVDVDELTFGISDMN